MTTKNCKSILLTPEKSRGVKPSVSRTTRTKRAGRISFWKPLTIDELARLQGVKPVRKLEDVLGGWPKGEQDDGFEKALAHWRTAPDAPAVKPR